MGVDEMIGEREIGLLNISTQSSQKEGDPSLRAASLVVQDIKPIIFPEAQVKKMDHNVANAPRDDVVVANAPRDDSKFVATPHDNSKATSHYDRLPTRELADSCRSLEELRKTVYAYKDLEIAKIANKVVFSDGVSGSKVMLIGEAPGANEDLQGIPFCGQSGQLLDAALETIGLSRKNNLYITNSVFWRPPANRRPTNDEIASCLPFVEKHIALINPNLIILAGATAVHSVLAIDEPITKIKAQNHFYTNKYLKKQIPVVILYHPSYLLRQASQKKTMWFDLLKIKREFL